LTNKPEPATVRVNDEEPHPFRNATVSAVSLMLYGMYTKSYELMAMTVVPIRLSRQDARKLDLLVKLGLYNSRTEAMRAMIQASADEQLNRYVLNDRVREALNELLQAEKRHGENPLHIASKKTAAEIVAESRQ
jgi:Arc/MetJ-type ribon-helix-helix transcriptional regulator